MNILEEIAQEFKGQYEYLDEDSLVIKFQHNALELFDQIPVCIIYSQQISACTVYAYVVADIEADGNKIVETCNAFNSQLGNYARYYFKDGSVIAALDFLILPDDTFCHIIAPAMVARVAKAVDTAYRQFYALQRQ